MLASTCEFTVAVLPVAVPFPVRTTGTELEDPTYPAGVAGNSADAGVPDIEFHSSGVGGALGKGTGGSNGELG